MPSVTPADLAEALVEPLRGDKEGLDLYLRQRLEEDIAGAKTRRGDLGLDEALKQLRKGRGRCARDWRGWALLPTLLLVLIAGTLWPGPKRYVEWRRHAGHFFWEREADLSAVRALNRPDGMVVEDFSDGFHEILWRDTVKRPERYAFDPYRWARKDENLETLLKMEPDNAAWLVTKANRLIDLAASGRRRHSSAGRGSPGVSPPPFVLTDEEREALDLYDRALQAPRFHAYLYEPHQEIAASFLPVRSMDEAWFLDSLSEWLWPADLREILEIRYKELGSAGDRAGQRRLVFDRQRLVLQSMRGMAHEGLDIRFSPTTLRLFRSKKTIESELTPDDLSRQEQLQALGAKFHTLPRILPPAWIGERPLIQAWYSPVPNQVAMWLNDQEQVLWLGAAAAWLGALILWLRQRLGRGSGPRGAACFFPLLQGLGHGRLLIQGVGLPVVWIVLCQPFCTRDGFFDDVWRELGYAALLGTLSLCVAARSSLGKITRPVGLGPGWGSPWLGRVVLLMACIAMPIDAISYRLPEPLQENRVVLGLCSAGLLWLIAKFASGFYSLRGSFRHRMTTRWMVPVLLFTTVLLVAPIPLINRLEAHYAQESVRLLTTPIDQSDAAREAHRLWEDWKRESP